MEIFALFAALGGNYYLYSGYDGLWGEVKSDKYADESYKTTRFPRAMLACRYLELVKAEKKLINIYRQAVL